MEDTTKIMVNRALMVNTSEPAPQVSAGNEAKPIHESDTLQVPSVAYPLPITPSTPSVPEKAVTHSKQQLANLKMTAMLQERCRQLCLSIFFRNQTKIQSLGLTSSVAGEGKSFLSMMMANVLATDTFSPVTLLECNWENPGLHEQWGFSQTPGLAEWLRGECTRSEICHQVSSNLTVIPAGNGRRDAVRLLQLMREKSISDVFLQANGLLLIDLPPIVTTAYGALAASLVDSLLLVVHSGLTTELLVAETLTQLKDLPIYGVMLNQVDSCIPRGIRQLF
jgi:Mrp family chromosome partitioning ATPase